MSSKVRLLTRAFDLSLEGDTVEEVEELLELMQARGLVGVVNRAAPYMMDSPDAKTDTSIEASAIERAGIPASDQFGAPVLADFIGATERAPEEGTGSRGVFKVLKREGETFILSPKFPPSVDKGERVDSAAMVLLMGYDQNGDTPITGSRLLKSLKQTGYNVERVDRELEPLIQKGMILTEGIRRGRRYRLSESGRFEARKLATELAALAGQPTAMGASA